MASGSLVPLIVPRIPPHLILSPIPRRFLGRQSPTTLFIRTIPQLPARGIVLVNVTMIDGIEVSRHNTKRSCWIVLDSRVFDVTSFLKEHPGGESVLMKQAGAVRTPLIPRV